MKKLRYVLYAFLLIFLNCHADGAFMSILGDKIESPELNDHGILSGKTQIKTQGNETVTVQTEKGSGTMQMTRPITTYHPSSEVWNFGPSKFSMNTFGADAKISMNNCNILIIEHNPGDTITQTKHHDGTIEEINRISGKETIVLYPDGTAGKLNLLSPDDQVYYFDDNEDVILKSKMGNEDLYYCINVNNLHEIYYKDYLLDGLEENYTYHQNRFKNPGKNIPDFEKIEEQIDIYFYNTATNFLNGAIDKDSTNDEFGWKILKIIVSNDNGQYLALASYTSISWTGEKFMGRDVLSSHPYYIYIDLSK